VKNSCEAVKHETILKFFKKCGISNALDGIEDDVLFQESGSLNNNSSNAECDSSGENFRGICDQYKLNTTVPFL
jgi:hypothetical protein